MKRDACIVGNYRYWLYREWDATKPTIHFVMLNPSTADASVDDPTIRRCISFATREGFGSLFVVNLYVWRATNPDELRNAPDPVGPHNMEFLASIGRAAAGCETPIVCAWGVAPNAEPVINLLRDKGAKLVCLGKTKNGSPRHPLYVRADAPMVPL